MNSNGYLTNLAKIVAELNQALDKSDHQKFLHLCAALHDFRSENAAVKMDDENDRQKIIDILPHIDCLIEKMESNKQTLANKIYTVRTSIQIAKNQDDLWEDDRLLESSTWQ